MNKQTMFTELSIQIAVVEAKLDKVLQLLKQPEVEYEVVNTISLSDHIHVGTNGSLQDRVFAPQWPNESRTDYMKRIGQYNEAQSIDEEFTGEFK